MDISLIICPDCGGVIGAVPEGHKPCVCDESARSEARGMPDPKPKVRVCCQCGKALEGKKRFKDSLGYWCEACHYAEKQAQKTDHIPCDSCGRYIAPGKLVGYENIRICSRCVREKREAAKKMRRPVVFGSEHRRHERQNLIILCSIALVLLLIILLSHYHLI